MAICSGILHQLRRRGLRREPQDGGDLDCCGAADGVLRAWRIGRSITKPLEALTDEMARLVGGDTNIAVSATSVKNEMARSQTPSAPSATTRWKMQTMCDERRPAPRRRCGSQKRQALQEMAHRIKEEAHKAVGAGVRSRAAEMTQAARAI